MLHYNVTILFNCYDDKSGPNILVARPYELSTVSSDFVLSASRGFLLSKIDQSEAIYNKNHGE